MITLIDLLAMLFTAPYAFNVGTTEGKKKTFLFSEQRKYAIDGEFTAQYRNVWEIMGMPLKNKKFWSNTTYLFPNEWLPILDSLLVKSNKTQFVNQM